MKEGISYIPNNYIVNLTSQLEILANILQDIFSVEHLVQSSSPTGVAGRGRSVAKSTYTQKSTTARRAGAQSTHKVAVGE